jgi:type IV secretory pathway TraG/TraD family ATPase VirD4
VGLLAIFIRKGRPITLPFDPNDPPLLTLTQHDAITLTQARCGILAIGGTGSGKTSTMSHLMEALMRCNGGNSGMVLLCDSSEDYEQIADLARAVGRESDLRRFCPGSYFRFNWLDYLIKSPGGCTTASQFMQDVIDFSSRMQSQNTQEPFFPTMAGRAISAAIKLIHKSTGTCSVTDGYEFLTSMPTTKDESKSKEFWDSHCGRTLLEVDKLPPDPDVQQAADFVLSEFVRLGDRTQGSVSAVALSTLSKFLHSHVRELLTGTTNLSPQDALEGRIVVIDLPILKYREIGQQIGLIWKLLTQRAALAREPNERLQDVVLWIDEAQLSIVPNIDANVAATARKHKLIQVYITQSLNLLTSVLKSQEDALAWIGNLSTKFIFANSDKSTNDYFSALFGYGKELLGTGGIQTQPYDLVADLIGHGPQGTYSFSESYQPLVRPEFFASGDMRKGGSESDYFVDFFVHQTGRRFSTGYPWLKTALRQRRA